MAISSSSPSGDDPSKPTGSAGASGSPTPPSATPSQKRPGVIISVSYGATVNIGDFETIRFDLSAAVAPDERWQDVLERLRGLVDKHKVRVKKERF